MGTGKRGRKGGLGGVARTGDVCKGRINGRSRETRGWKERIEEAEVKRRSE